MDFKGITWAGDIYEKFESMCLEVEEVMCEDTIKYMENQVQKVGVNVKKLCSEIMQDLLPPSCLGPHKGAELLLEPCALTDINEKPKPTISVNHGELTRKQAGVEDISNKTAEDSTLIVRSDTKHIPPMSLRVLVGNARSEEWFRKSKRAAGLTRRSIGIKRISHSPKVTRVMPSSSGDGSALLVHDTRSNCSVASDDLNATTTLSECFTRDDHGEAVTKNEPIVEVSAKSCDSDLLSAESIEQEKNDESDQELPAESLRQNSDATEWNSSSHGLPPAPIDKSAKDGSLSQIKSNITDTCKAGSMGEEAIPSYEDDFDIEVIEPENVLDPAEKSKLEESCILVEGDELHSVSQGSKKHKSYKKRIFDVLSSKLRPTRKQNHQDLSVKNMVCDKREVPADSSCDFGWELL